MLDFGFTFEHKAYLLLLLPLLPAVWWLSRKSLAGLSRCRRWCAITLRMVVIVLIVAAMAGIQFERITKQVTAIFLLDQSLSIPQQQRQAILQYVNQAVRTHHKSQEEDEVGVIVFGRDAAVEYPPADFFAGLPPQVETAELDPEHTNLAGAMKRAMAMFSGDSAKRVIVISDGNENLGDARRQARALADASVSVDVVPITLEARNEISVEKIAVPADVRKDQPFDMRVVVNNDPGAGGVGETVTGKLRIVRRTSEREVTIVEQQVKLPPGKRAFPVPEEIDRAAFYTYEAIFVPDDPDSDGTSRNNSATAFTHVRGKGQVLLIEDFKNPGQFGFFVDRLRSEGLEVSVQASNQLFTSLPELNQYDAVILANVPRSSGDSADEIAHFSDEQISMLVRNTQMGSGLIMLGGDRSFGAGSWTNTELEKAMPVDFQIKSKKVAPVGALVLMMHAGEMPKANYWQKRIAIESIKALGYEDYCGLVQWNGTDQWLWGSTKGQGMTQVGPNRQSMLKRVGRMTIGDMPAFDGAMNMASSEFARLANDPTAMPTNKHMIIISDGDPTPPVPATMNQLINLGVKVSTVAVGSHGTLGSNTMQRISAQTGGKYYVVKSANNLPKIYQREVRKVAQPVIYEPQKDMQLIPRVAAHKMLEGIAPEGLPPIRGFVMTSVKGGALPEILLIAPEPAEDNATVLAAWQYGLGKSVAFTTDVGQKWANAWTGWPGYDRFFSQMVRWTMRPVDENANYTVSTQSEQGRTQVVVTAMDKDNQFLNMQSMSGIAVAPDMQMNELSFRQVAPGRYMAEFDSEQSGSYSISISPGVGTAPIRTGVSVGYSDEYRDRETNLPLLESLAAQPAKGGEPGKLIQDDPATPSVDERLQANPFRRDLPPARSVQDIWPLLVFFASFVFFSDVFVRRVQIGMDWVTPLAASLRDRILRREAQVPQEATLSRLQSRKQEVSEQIATRRGSTRFESGADSETDPSVLQQASRSKPPASRGEMRQQPSPSAEPQEEDSYTSRLLKAKKDVWKDRGK